jgi:hypothetical protein
MRKLRLLLLAAAFTAASMALPAYASGGPGGGGTGGGGTAGGGTTVAFRNFKMAGALFATSNPALLTGAMQYTLDSTGRARLIVGYFNTAQLPAGTVLDVLADGVKVGSLVTSAQGGVMTLATGVPSLTLQSRISLSPAAGTTVASGAFTLNI